MRSRNLKTKHSYEGVFEIDLGAFALRAIAGGTVAVGVGLGREGPPGPGESSTGGKDMIDFFDSGGGPDAPESGPENGSGPGGESRATSENLPKKISDDPTITNVNQGASDVHETDAAAAGNAGNAPGFAPMKFAPDDALKLVSEFLVPKPIKVSWGMIWAEHDCIPMGTNLVCKRCKGVLGQFSLSVDTPADFQIPGITVWTGPKGKGLKGLIIDRPKKGIVVKCNPAVYR
jgi:hypothetical protein